MSTALVELSGGALVARPPREVSNDSEEAKALTDRSIHRAKARARILLVFFIGVAPFILHFS
jgi:hypothetical protein